MTAPKIHSDGRDHAPFGGADFEIEFAQEVHPEQAVNVVVAEIKHVDGKARHREAKHGELGHAYDVALLLTDRGTNDLLACAIGAIKAQEQEMRELKQQVKGSPTAHALAPLRIAGCVATRRSIRQPV